MARPRNTDWHAAFLRCVERTGDIVVSSRQISVARSTVYHHLEHDRIFRVGVREAGEKFTEYSGEEPKFWIGRAT